MLGVQIVEVKPHNYGTAKEASPEEENNLAQYLKVPQKEYRTLA